MTRKTTSLLLAMVPAMIFASTPEMMSAVMVSDRGAHLEQVPTPVAGEGEVGVRIAAIAVHPIEWKNVANRAAGSAPYVPGGDGAGTIDSIGPGVRGWRVGARVFFRATGRGVYAQYAVVPADVLVKTPSHLSDAEAVSLATATTPWNTLVDQVNFMSGKRFLVHAAAGGTGSAAVQLIKARGGYVIGTASAGNHSYLRSIGVDEVIDYTQGKFEDQVHDVDVVFNAANAETAERSIAVVKKGGMLLSIAGTPDADHCRAAGIVCASPPADHLTPPVEVLRQVAELARAGRFKVNVDARYPLPEFQQAWNHSQQGHTRGQIVIVNP